MKTATENLRFEDVGWGAEVLTPRKKDPLHVWHRPDDIAPVNFLGRRMPF